MEEEKHIEEFEYAELEDETSENVFVDIDWFSVESQLCDDLQEIFDHYKQLDIRLEYLTTFDVLFGTNNNNHSKYFPKKDIIIIEMIRDFMQILREYKSYYSDSMYEDESKISTLGDLNDLVLTKYNKEIVSERSRIRDLINFKRFLSIDGHLMYTNIICSLNKYFVV